MQVRSSNDTTLALSPPATLSGSWRIITSLPQFVRGVGNLATRRLIKLIKILLGDSTSHAVDTCQHTLAVDPTGMCGSAGNVALFGINTVALTGEHIHSPSVDGPR